MKVFVNADVARECVGLLRESRPAQKQHDHSEPENMTAKTLRGEFHPGPD